MGLIPLFEPRIKTSLPSLFLLNICEERSLINSSFFNCNFNFSATSKALNSSSSLSGKSNFDFKYVSQVAINKYSEAISRLRFFELVMNS